MFEEKTIEKKACRSQRIVEEKTIKQNQSKCKSQIIHTQSSVFFKRDKKFIFKVFMDCQLGLKLNEIPTIPMEIDQDCQTTESLKNYGEQLCVSDLKFAIKIPNEQTDSYWGSPSRSDY